MLVLTRRAGESVVIGDDIRYAASQPWPFPSSLMVGFFARAERTAITVDEDEITDARWFSRADLLAAAEQIRVRLPGAVSISRRLIEAWYGGPLPGNW